MAIGPPKLGNEPRNAFGEQPIKTGVRWGDKYNFVSQAIDVIQVGSDEGYSFFSTHPQLNKRILEESKNC